MTKYLIPAAILTFVGCTKTQEYRDAISDEDFVQQASVVNTTEIDIGGLGTIRANDEGITEFAQMIAGYHKDEQNQLKRLASGLNLVATDSLDAQHIMLENQLLDLSGRSFDSIYIHTRVQDYREAVQLFFQEMISGQNDQLREYSASVLPQVESYLHLADSLSSKY